MCFRKELFIYIYIYTHVYTYMYIYIYVHIGVHTYIHIVIYMLCKQLYKYNKLEAIICSHRLAAPFCSQPHQLSSCSPVARHLLLLCLPRLVRHLLPHVSAVPTSLTVPLIHIYIYIYIYIHTPLVYTYL